MQINYINIDKLDFNEKYTITHIVTKHSDSILGNFKDPVMFIEVKKHSKGNKKYSIHLRVDDPLVKAAVEIADSDLARVLHMALNALANELHKKYKN
jgi:hypothetical protein